MNPPCWQCIRRYPACHGGCPDYAKFREAIEAEAQRRRKEKDVIDYQKRTAARIAKRRHARKDGRFAE